MNKNTPLAELPPLTAQEAIGLAKAAAEDMELQDMPRFAQAVRLGREALIRLRDSRLVDHGEFDYSSPLPGEAQDGTVPPPQRDRARVRMAT